MPACLSPASPAVVLAAGVVVVAAAVSGAGSIRDRPRGPTKSCVTEQCHAGITSHRRTHAPVAQQKCEACHVEVDTAAHRFDIVGDPAELCVTCHVIPQRTFSHAPVRQGNCTGCHDPHGSDHAMMLVADPTEGLCVGCHHRDVDMDLRFVHGPAAAGACIVCHEAHSSWHPALLAESPQTLCMGCHPETRPDPQRDRYHHDPVADDCGSCHDPHASSTRFQLHADAPELCYRCHGAMRDHVRTAAVVHGAMDQEGGCLVCHAAHFAPLPALQRREEIDLCLECHDRTLPASGNRVLTDMSSLLEDNPHHHGPVRDGACTVCHLPHAAGQPQLLRLAYPPEFYAPYEPDRYALCFECHLPAMVQGPQGTGVTGFRHGDLNLHWLHVNREKGRTCRACHDVHASSNPFHLRDSVPFGTGGWALDIGFIVRPAGGTCNSGCHVTQTYNRDLETGGAGPAPESVAEDEP